MPVRHAKVLIPIPNLVQRAEAEAPAMNLLSYRGDGHAEPGTRVYVLFGCDGG